MVTQLILVLLIVLTSLDFAIGADSPQGNAPQTDSPEVHKIQLSGPYCAYDGERIVGEIYGFPPDAPTEKLLKEIADYGPQQEFVLWASNVPNAAALNADKQKLLLYNQVFARDLMQRTKSSFAIKAILAHEVAHHLLGHTFQGSEDRHHEELQADRYSGVVLQGLGSTMDEAVMAVENIASVEGSETHPPRSARIAAVVSGWYKKDDILKYKKPGTKTSASAASTIIATIKLDDNGEDDYYLTTDLDVLKFTPEGRISLVGQRSKGDNPKYPFTYKIGNQIYDEDIVGGIWSTSDGKPIRRGSARFSFMGKPFSLRTVEGMVTEIIMEIDNEHQMKIKDPGGHEVSLRVHMNTKLNEISKGDAVMLVLSEDGHVIDMHNIASAYPSSGKPGVPGQKEPAAAGSVGEQSVGGSGPAGTSVLPVPRAPQFEGGNPSSRR